VIKNIAIKLTGWTLALFMVCYLGLTFFPVTANSVNMDLSFLSGKLDFFQRWSNWDGGAYLRIAEKGYGIMDTDYAFFPAYPLAIKLVSFITLGNYLFSAQLVSWFSLFFSLIFLYKLVRLDFSSEVAEKTLNYLLIFPTSFFLLATYTEPMYLFFTIASLYYFRKFSYFKSSVFGAISTAVRIVGINIFPAILFEMIENKKIKKSKTIFAVILIPVGLLAYMLYCFLNKGNALYFTYIHDKYWQRDQITYPFKVLLAYIKNFFLHPGNPFTSRDSSIICLEFLVSVIFLALIVFVWLKVRRSYALYALLVWSMPLITGRTGSMLRCVLVLFPCFIALALIGNKYKNFDKFYLFLSAMLLAVFAISFINGYWIA
jgi:Gpi18-like mannosyltransferase